MQLNVDRINGVHDFCQHYFHKFPNQKNKKWAMSTDFAVFANSVNFIFYVTFYSTLPTLLSYNPECASFGYKDSPVGKQ